MLPRVFQSASLATLLFAMAVALLGPILDHHFAERQANHVHIYSGPVDPSHVHSYETPHDYLHARDGLEASAEGPSSGDSPPDDIVYLTSNKEMLLFFDSVAAPTVYAAFAFLDSEDEPLISGISSDDKIPPEAIIVPPQRPPRV